MNEQFLYTWTINNNNIEHTTPSLRCICACVLSMKCFHCSECFFFLLRGIFFRFGLFGYFSVENVIFSYFVRTLSDIQSAWENREKNRKTKRLETAGSCFQCSYRRPQTIFAQIEKKVCICSGLRKCTCSMRLIPFFL